MRSCNNPDYVCLSEDILRDKKTMFWFFLACVKLAIPILIVFNLKMISLILL